MLMGIDGIYNDEDTPDYREAALNLPYDVPANEFMNIEGKQFSKSRNWAIWVPDILERYQAGCDSLLCGHDASRRRAILDFAWDGFLCRVNNELVAAWGNLVNRDAGIRLQALRRSACRTTTH